MNNKELFRKVQLAKLKKGHFYKANFIVFKEIIKIIKTHKIKNILIYIPLAYELDLCRFRKILSKKCKIFVPFMQDTSLKMVRLRTPFHKKRFGIYEPNDSLFKAKIELAIVPVVGVDKHFKRVGHGYGFYDRFFEKLDYKPLIIFVSSLDALSKQNLSQTHDIQGDFYINPKKKYLKKEFKNANNFNRTYSRYHRRRNRIFSC